MERAGRKAGSGIKKNRHRGMYVLRCYFYGTLLRSWANTINPH